MPVTLKFLHGTIHVSRDAKAIATINVPSLMFLCVFIIVPPIISPATGCRRKNAIEKCMCIRPQYSGKTPTPISEIESNIRMKAPILLENFLNLKIMPIENISINIPAIISPELKYIWEGSIAPKSLKAFLVHENHGACEIAMNMNAYAIIGDSIPDIRDILSKHRVSMTFIVYFDLF